MFLHERKKEKPMKTMMLLGLMALAQIASGQPETLEPYRWKNRIVLLFGSSANATVQKQLAELKKDPAGMTDRDLLIFHVDKKRNKINQPIVQPGIIRKPIEKPIQHRQK